jgi:23S rRNA (uridine2552-2'-O)-methyltransferase
MKQRDKHSRLASKQGFRARSIFKLQQINKRFEVIKKSNSVLDLGSYPGSWLQWLSQHVEGFILGVDIQKINPIKGTEFLQADLTEEDTITKIKEIRETFDVVVSDAAPKTTGMIIVDTARSYDVCKATLNIAVKVLKPKGNYVAKMYQGEETDLFFKEVKQHFHKVFLYRPRTTKRRSKEVFIIAKGLKAKN